MEVDEPWALPGWTSCGRWGTQCGSEIKALHRVPQHGGHVIDVVFTVVLTGVVRVRALLLSLRIYASGTLVIQLPA